MLVAVALLVSGAVVLFSPLGISAPDSWTFMVYLDADNNLEGYGIDDFLEMSSVGSVPGEVNIVVQFDRMPGYDSSYGDWTTCKRFLVMPGMMPIAVSAWSDIGEVDMGHPSTLADFVNWSVNTFSTTNYALVLWDHGGNWHGVSWDMSSGSTYLDMSELETALQDVKTANPWLTLDIIAFDACSMGSLEVAYQVRSYGRYMVASEISVPLDGFEYSGPLAALVANPNMTGVELSNEILDHYAEYYLSLAGTPDWFMLNESFTLSLVDLGAVDEVATAADALARELADNLGLWVNHVSLARELTEAYLSPWTEDSVDLYHLAENIVGVTPNATVDALAEDLMLKFGSCVLNETHGTNPNNTLVPVNHTHGLMVQFEDPALGYDPEYPLSGLQFTADTYWDEFLMLYDSVRRQGRPTVMQFSPEGPSVPQPVSVEIWFSEPMNASSLSTAFSILPSVPGSFSLESEKLTFWPDMLEPGVTYTITISTAAKDLSGSYMLQNFSWQFTAGEVIPEFPSVLPPILLMLVLFVVVLRRSKDG